MIKLKIIIIYHAKFQCDRLGGAAGASWKIEKNIFAQLFIFLW